MTDVDNFAEHPISLTEARSNKSQDASDWTPRDALIALLRRIDRGEVAPEALVVVFRHPGDVPGAVQTGWTVASSDPHITLGILQRAIQNICT